MENITLKIDQETQDLVLDDSGSLELIGDAETVAQCVRLTLETFKGEWFLDTDHGTDYDQIIGDGDGNYNKYKVDDRRQGSDYVTEKPHTESPSLCKLFVNL